MGEEGIAVEEDRLYAVNRERGAFVPLIRDTFSLYALQFGSFVFYIYMVEMAQAKGSATYCARGTRKMGEGAEKIQEQVK